LPFLVGLGLIISTNLWHIPIGILAWFLAVKFQRFFLHMFPLAVGWAYGNIVLTNLYPDSKFIYYCGGIIGSTVIFIICSFVVAYVTTPIKDKIPEKQNEIIQKLDNLEKCLFFVLLDKYKLKFPNDSDKKSLQRTGAILNELVLFELKDDQVIFKRNNIDFFDEEKINVIKCDDIRIGIISFLIAKGGLYKYRNYPKANIWIDEARKIQPNVLVPNSLSEISKEIDDCINYYRKNTVIGDMELDWESSSNNQI